MVASDNNTNYFHHFSFTRRVNNAMWDMKNPKGEPITGNRGLKDLSIDHFAGIYSKSTNPDLIS